ncbi:MAG: hypothetical protein E7604_03235 [Ruminococcaceae bacterium]|nr:hypothetical protein [Oscillospiraceae bacterium]
MNIYNILEHGVTADTPDLQTAEIQAVLDLCQNGGGKVIFPAGKYRAAGLYMHSDTTIYLESGAILEGSDNCDDYAIFPFPDGVEDYSDMLLLRRYYGKPWDAYRRAILSAYGEHNLSIIGEEGSVIDGVHCYDPDGEEGYRGPHMIYFTNCDNITLHGYTARYAGNFMHQLDKCNHTTMTNVTCIGGSDGIHLHYCDDTLIDGCVFHTGDDCIAGIYVTNLRVRRCELNTSCDVFRIGGVHILVEDCHIHGPGIWPHRKTVVRGRNDELPQNEGRHNTICVMIYFASIDTPDPEPSHDIVFKNCRIEGVDTFLHYNHRDLLSAGTHLTEVRLENVTFRDLNAPCYVLSPEDDPLHVHLHGVSVHFRENAENPAGLFDGLDPNTHRITE